MQTSAPCLLVANPILVDPNFLRSVVLLVEHNEEGAFGLALNRPLPMMLDQICAEGGMDYAGPQGAVAWRGGPVEPQRGVLLVEGGLPESEDTVLDMTHFLSHRKDLLEALLQNPEAKYRLYLGYAGWGPGQLDMEMEEGAWTQKPLVSSWLLDANPSNLWHLAMAEGPGLKLLAALLAATALVGAAPAWDIHARLTADGSHLEVEARFAPGDADTFMVDAAAAPFLSGLEAETNGQWKAVPGVAGRWPVADAEARGAHLRWTFDFGAAARARRSGVRPFGSGFLFRPRAWLVRPETFLPGRSARLVVETPPDLSFVSGLGPGPSYLTRVDDLDGGPEAAVGPLRLTRFPAKGGVIAAIAPDGDLPLTPPQESRWFTTAASALEDAYGRLPLPWTAVFLLPVGQGTGVLFGSTRGGGGAAIVVLLGRSVSDEDLADDWILTHELIHTALPDLDREHHWFEEGIPTYLEPLLRLREGRERAESFWGDLRSKLPQGQPQAQDRGLDRTPTWGRTYWGGALFCFVADLRIREATHGKQTLLDALRAMLPAGGIATHGEIRALLAQGDAALAKPVLVPLYDAWAERPETVDLDAIWKRLGVAPSEDHAPEGELRRTWSR